MRLSRIKYINSLLAKMIQNKLKWRQSERLPARSWSAASVLLDIKELAWSQWLWSAGLIVSAALLESGEGNVVGPERWRKNTGNSLSPAARHRWNYRTHVSVSGEVSSEPQKNHNSRIAGCSSFLRVVGEGLDTSVSKSTYLITFRPVFVFA